MPKNKICLLILLITGLESAWAFDCTHPGKYFNWERDKRAEYGQRIDVHRATIASETREQNSVISPQKERAQRNLESMREAMGIIRFMKDILARLQNDLIRDSIDQGVLLEIRSQMMQSLAGTPDEPLSTHFERSLAALTHISDEDRRRFMDLIDILRWTENSQTSWRREEAKLLEGLITGRGTDAADFLKQMIRVSQSAAEFLQRSTVDNDRFRLDIEQRDREIAASQATVKAAEDSIHHLKDLISQSYATEQEINQRLRSCQTTQRLSEAKRPGVL